MEIVMEEQNQPIIARHMIEFIELVDEGEEDRISALPDCLLLEILSRLHSTKDAIRTGTLSNRWKRLWTLVHTLIFEESEAQEIHDFVSIVEKTLTQCRQLKLKKLLVYTRYNIRFESQVNNWIRHAIKCNVEELNLTLWNEELEAEFLVDQSFLVNSCFTDLTLEGCIFNPIGAISWKNLRRLCIIQGKLDEDLIENILSGSPHLETLVLEYCYGYKRLDITSKSVKKLVLFENLDPDNVFVINAPNILSLTMDNELLSEKILLLKKSSLVEANIDYSSRMNTPEEEEEEMLKGSILNFGHVKVLKIGGLYFCSKVVSRLEAKGFVFPSNTKFPSVAIET